MILCLYLLPIVALIAYNVLVENESNDWNALSVGIFLASIGTLIFFWVMARWTVSHSDVHLRHPADMTPDDNSIDQEQVNLPTQDRIDPEEYKITKLSLEEAQQAQIRLLQEIDILTEDLLQSSINRKQDQQHLEKIKSEIEQLRDSSSQHQEQQQRYIREQQGTIAEQKTLVEKKQQQIGLLEAKVNDLTHEIKTLFQFAESRAESLLSPIPPEDPPLPIEHPQVPQPTQHEENPAQPNQEALHLLKRCLDIAQKIMGSQRFGSQLYSFLESPADNYSLDLRRLCDRLRGETNGTILLYSPKEHQLLFASNQVKELTGWSPEKFVQNFGEILHDKTTWNRGVEGLARHNETQTKLSLSTRSGHSVSLQAHLGMIPSGIFRNHIIAVVES